MIRHYLSTISQTTIFSLRKCCCCTTRHTEFSSPPGNLYDTRYISIKKRRQNKRLRGFFKWIIHRRYRKLMKTNSIASCAHSFCSFRFFSFRPTHCRVQIMNKKRTSWKTQLWADIIIFLFSLFFVSWLWTCVPCVCTYLSCLWLKLTADNSPHESGRKFRMSNGNMRGSQSNKQDKPIC